MADNTPLWLRLGPPAWYHCAGIVNSLPKEVRLALSRPTTEVITLLLFLCWHQAWTYRQRTLWCSPSVTYLSTSVGRHPRTIKRCLAFLASMGLLRKWRRTFQGKTPQGQRWLGHAGFAPGPLLLGALYRFTQGGTIEQGMPQAYSHQDELTARWEEFCRQRGADPERVLEPE